MTGEPALLIHGWGACVYTFRFALQALAGAGKRAVAFDLRGHGLSDKPVGRDEYTTAVLLGDIRALLNQYKLERVDLVGHSLGGALAMRFALENAPRVRRLVLAAPVGLTRIPWRAVAHLLTPRVTERLARYLPPRWMTAFLLRGAYGDPRRVSDEVIDEYWAPSQFPEYYRAVRTLLEKFAWQPLSSEQLARVQARTLVMLGAADRLIRKAENVTTRIPNSEALQFEGAGHLGIEECASEFNAALVRFLGDEKSV